MHHRFFDLADTKESSVALAVVVSLLVICVITFAVVTVVFVRKLRAKVLAIFRATGSFQLQV